MAADIEPAALPPADPARLLLIWLSPSFPVGAFAYSHGLEAAVARGLVKDRPSLEDWLRALLTHGSGRNDCILLAHAWRASAAVDLAALRDVNDLALALQPSAERHLESSQQGGSFLATVAAAWSVPSHAALTQSLTAPVAYPVAVGLAAAAHRVPLAATVHAFAAAFVQTLVSAAIRLSVIGQTDGQRIIAAVWADLDAVARMAITAGLDELGGATWSSDLASLEHETLYSRLFRS